MTERSPVAVYESRMVELNAHLQLLAKKKTMIAWLRFGAVIVAFALLYLLWPQSIALALLLFFACFGGFLRLVVLDLRNKTKIENAKLLVEINREEIKIAGHDYTHRDDGSRFANPLHPYTNDLDIFGRASLYQYINRTCSDQGNEALAAWLNAPVNDPETIIRVQTAARELSLNIVWRQQLQAFGLHQRLTSDTRKKVNKWLNEPALFPANSAWKILRYLLPAIILTCLLLTILDIIPAPVFSGIALLFFIVAGNFSRKIMPVYDDLNKIATEIDTLSNSASCIEQIVFHAPALQELQNPFGKKEKRASVIIKRLKGILDRFDIRLNPFVFIPLNTLLFWDVQQAFALENWKAVHKKDVDWWFGNLGQIEGICSIANLIFNHPEWCIPDIAEQPGLLAGDAIGHPLIVASKRVDSSFTTAGLNQLALITGSNMAGKSTFLRSIGVNIVLAMIGAPVAAKKFKLSPTRIMSSMRIADNLEESTSTFYAELKKLKTIIDAVNGNETIFILLDEILRGTNSLDRYTGSKALIRQLIRHQAVGMIATHDLELAKLAMEYPENIHNYHFDVQVANDELYFDYKLKEGVCESMNASILMKKIGIEL